MGAGGRATSRWVLALCLLGSAGCCHIPHAEQYFDRRTPFNALNGFAYAVETGQYRFAYDCLTPGSREHFTFTRFKLALRFRAEVPQLGISLHDLILDSTRSRGIQGRRITISGDQAEIMVYYTPPNGVTTVRFSVFLEQIRAEPSGTWLLDLEKTIADFPGIQEGELARSTVSPGGEKDFRNFR